MPYKDPEKRRAYYRERYRKQKEQEKESLFKDKLRYTELAQKSHLSELDPRERVELDALQDKLIKEDTKYLDPSAPLMSEIVGLETVALDLEDPSTWPDLPPYVGRGFDSEGSPIPLEFRGLPDETIIRLKHRKVYPSEVGRGGNRSRFTGKTDKKAQKEERRKRRPVEIFLTFLGFLKL